MLQSFLQYSAGLVDERKIIQLQMYENVPLNWKAICELPINHNNEKYMFHQQFLIHPEKSSTNSIYVN